MSAESISTLFFDNITHGSETYFYNMQKADQLDTLSLFQMEFLQQQFTARHINSENNWPNSNITELQFLPLQREVTALLFLLTPNVIARIKLTH